jgi:uncharacterized protein (TIGR01777 family)
VRVVVAGSSGLIGTGLVQLLRHAGHEVTRLVRRRTDAGDERSWDPPGGRIEEGALAGAGAVVNLCGAGIGDKRWTEARKQVLRDSRTIPTEVLATAVARAGVPVLLNASAVGYYGDTGDRTVDETAPRGDGFLAGLCEEWEAATAAAAEAGSRVVLLRSGIVLAAQGGMLGQLAPLFSWLLGGRLGSGAQYMSWISLDDELAAIRFLLEHDSVSGPVNLTGPVPATNAEFTRAMGDVVHRPAPWAIPPVALRIALGEFADEGLLAGQRAVPAVLQRNGFAFAHESVHAALNATLGSLAGRRG